MEKVRKIIQTMQNKELYIFSMKRSGQHAIINWLCKQNQPSLHYNACTFKNSPIPTNKIYEYKNGYVECSVRANKKFDHSLYNLIIYNFEDQSPQKLSDKHKNKITIITRDIYNLVASRLKKDLVWHKSIWMDLDKWNGYKIHFDTWFINKDYRKQICNDLNIPFTDDGLQDVFDNGESSFDGKTKDGKAQEMDVLYRWKEWENNSKYKKIIRELK